MPPVYGTQVNDVLLAGLARAFAALDGRAALWVDLEGHGREELFDGVDLSRTAGWFTAIYPVRLEVPDEPGAALKAVKEQLRARAAQGRGLRPAALDGGRGDARGAGGAAAAAGELQLPGADGRRRAPAGSAAPAARTATSGRLRSPARAAHAPAGGGRGGGGRAAARHLDATHPACTERATVERLAAGYLEALRELVAHCRDPQAGGYTPSDFALAGLDQDGLDALLSQIG